LRRMILVEPDDDLAGCVSEFFRNRFEVVRKDSLDEAGKVMNRDGADVLLADISSLPAGDASIVEQIRRESPDSKVVLTYLAPAVK